ncbi:TonB-dependent siderophore receptor [Chlorogloeopsis sp. ULAP01]|uniref:TonB-dependent siderophore receptor n=1 Tax=Chlorogloeopsis sp. ULAP01 TaxID=3056483 RepID=UPI0025AA9A31|nr:TonB-dependent siderophore receptor [Chlorogloeopsis sp. ULAP01]MDM9379749.1 TonB-dependent siderophore receptor [Chlorogloeopsis sp. ULAP01]
MKGWRSTSGSQCCVRYLNIYLGLIVTVVGSFSSVLAEVEQVLASQNEQQTVVPKIKTISEADFPATSVKDLVSQSPPHPPVSPLSKEGVVVLITGVKANPTEKGVEIILQTSQGEQLQVTNRSEGNNFIADMPNAQLRLPNGDAFTFSSEKPIEGITQITVANIDANTVRVTVAGEKALPAVELFDDDIGLIFAVASTATSAQNPTPPASPLPLPRGGEGEGSEQPAAQQDDPIELVVTGEQDGYRVEETSVGTRTDTPLRDIPQSIQIVPQQVIQDTQARSITEALENVPGVVAQGAGSTGTRDYFTIRGFEAYGSLVNGLPDPQITSDGIFFNVEQLEVLKGPASVLYGDTGLTSIGGTINYVTKKPLSEPFFEISTTAGNYGFLQSSLDLSGPLNTDKTALYRLIAGFRYNDSITDFNSAGTLAIAPSLSLQLGEKTSLLVEGDVNRVERNGQQPGPQPVLGTLLPNPNGKISRSFNPIGPVPNNVTYNGRVGYRLEHQFNENLKLRNAFRYVFAQDDDSNIDFFPTDLEADNRTLNREGSIGEQYYNYYLLDTNLLSKFTTGTIEHQLLAGFSLSRNTTDLSYEFGIPAAPVDIFDPVYDQTLVTGDRTFSRFTTRDTLGIYLQDQISLSQNFKLLLGGRFDTFSERATNRLTNIDSSQSDTAFSPRVGIVYQPIQPISLYASYSRSFTPSIGTAASGETFQPERGTQYEIGVKADLSERLSATLAFYDLTRSNVTTPDPINPNFSVQTGKQRSRGIEFDISGEILPGWNIIAGYAYTDARVTEDNSIPVGNRLFNAPEHTVNLWTTYRIQTGSLKGLGFGLGLYYLGDRPLDNANTVNLPSFFRTDAAIFYEQEQFRAALNFRNIFDIENYVSRYGSSDFVQIGTPFTIQGSLSWRF